MVKADGPASTTARALARDVARRMRRLFDNYVSLPLRAPERIVVAPPDPMPGKADLATEMYGGTFRLAGISVETLGESPFGISNAPDIWAEALHGFGWMRHHRAAETDLARLHVRTLLSDWIKLHGETARGLPWRPLVAATRLRHWISHSPVVLGHGDFTFLDDFLRQLAVHHRYVRRAVRESIDPLERARLLAVLCTVSLAFPSSRQEQRKLAAALSTELDAQVLPDGGHRSRRSSASLELASDLLPLAQCFDALGLVTPPAVIRAIDRMLPFVAMHQHTDGSLTRHNGTRGARIEMTEAIVALSPSVGPPPAEAPLSGYHRLAIGDTVVIVDTGTVPPIDYASRAHAGVLSFEMSVGRGDTATPLIVNIGDVRDEQAELSDALRTLPAHSTLAIDGSADSWTIVKSGLQSRLFANPLTGGPTEVEVRRADAQDGSWRGFRASHDGLAQGAGPARAVHARTFALSNGGTKLAGRDELIAPADAPDGWSSPPATVRFHLHPSIDAEPLGEGNSRFTLQPERGAAWVLEVEGAKAQVEDGIYIVHEARVETRQIVLRIAAGGGAANWTFTRRDDR